MARTSKRQVTVYMDESAYQRLVTLSQLDGRSMSNFIVHLLIRAATR
jgi:predicted CopG family antitoxin